MAPRLRKRGVPIGLAAVAAVAIGVAAAQRPSTETDQPAQLDRTFGPDGGVGGAAGRDPGMSTDPDGGMVLGFDGGAGPGGVSTAPGDVDAGEGVGGSGAPGGNAPPAPGFVDGGGGVGGSGAPDDSARGRDGGTADGGAGGSAQAAGHTNIIVYGPNGIPPEKRSADR